uniref:Uncharacterized protein n=1 Tax=Populus trichocarpa TaxID=3694 RepID=B9MVE7_POPTR
MEDGHFLGCVKGEWSFLWVCPRKDVWEDGYYLELIGLPSKCLGSDMFVKPILPWTWLTAKPMYFSLACLSNPRYLGLGGLPCLIALGLACLPDPRYLGLGGLPYLIALGVSRKDDHFLGHAKRGYDHSIGCARAWHITKPNHVMVWLASYPAFPGLGTLLNPITLRSG